MKRMSERSTMVACSVSFFALGLVTAAIGPALPELAANTVSSLATLGGLFTALFLGALLSQAIAGPLNDRVGQRPVLLGGLALLALGTLGVVTSHTLPLLLACAVIAGLGHGAIDVSTTVLIAEVFASRSAAALNLLNVFFGAGAVAGPAIAGLALRTWGTALPTLWLGTGLLLLQAPLVPLLAVAPRVPHEQRRAARSVPLYRSPLLWALGLLLLLYVGTENGVGGWLPTYLLRTTTLAAASAALATSAFWLALTGGRVVGALLGTRLAPHALLFISLAGSLAGGLILALSAGSAPLTIAGVLVLGLCFGPIFPTTLAITTGTFRHSAGTAASVVVALGSVGGMLLPWLQGVLLDRSGPSASMWLVALSTLAMLALHVGRGLLTGRPAHDKPGPLDTVKG